MRVYKYVYVVVNDSLFLTVDLFYGMDLLELIKICYCQGAI